MSTVDARALRGHRATSASMFTSPGWLARHLRQDANLMGTMLAFGMSSLVILIAANVRLDLENDSIFALAVVMAPIAGLPGPVVLLARLLRRAPRHARCSSCRAAPAAEVRYLQVTGIVVIALLKEARLDACTRCSAQACVATTAHTAALGWWSMLTPLVVPWVLLNNLAFYLKNRLATRGTRGAAGALEEHREYARNLLRTKETAIVVEVLAEKTGLSPADVEAWLKTIPQEQPR